MKIDTKDFAKIALDKNKEYIFVFSKKSGLCLEDIEMINHTLENWKISILIGDINEFRVIEK